MDAVDLTEGFVPGHELYLYNERTGWFDPKNDICFSVLKYAQASKIKSKDWIWVSIQLPTLKGKLASGYVLVEVTDVEIQKTYIKIRFILQGQMSLRSTCAFVMKDSVGLEVAKLRRPKGMLNFARKNQICMMLNKH